jgi:hypothetical protein
VGKEVPVDQQQRNADQYHADYHEEDELAEVKLHRTNLQENTLALGLHRRVPQKGLFAIILVHILYFNNFIIWLWGFIGAIIDHHELYKEYQ